jgi:hypothetical protein
MNVYVFHHAALHQLFIQIFAPIAENIVVN